MSRIISKSNNIQLYHGDTLEIMGKLVKEGVKVDAIITDPPYGTTSNSWDSIIPLNEMWKKLRLLLKPKGTIVLFSSQPFTSALISSNINGYRHSWVYKKANTTGFQRVKYEPLRCTEDIVVFSSNLHLNDNKCHCDKILEIKEHLKKRKSDLKMTTKNLNTLCGFEASGYLRTTSSWANILPPEGKDVKLIEVLQLDIDFLESLKLARDNRDDYTFNPQGIIEYNKKNKRKATGENWSDLQNNEYIQEKTNYPTNLLEYQYDKLKIHSTQKPVALMEYLINTYTNKGEVILDFTCGSGSTLVACENTDRKGIGIDNGYCKKDQTINNIHLKDLSWVTITKMRLDGEL